MIYCFSIHDGCFTYMLIILFSYLYQKYINSIMKQVINTIANKADKSVILTRETPRYSLLWLHGLGDSPAGFLDLFEVKQSPVHEGARVKLLHAPIRPVTANGGMKMPSWYDIKTFDFSSSQQKRYSSQQIKESLKIIDEHVELQKKYWEELAKIKNQQIDPYKKIFIGGFSQGCAMSLLYGLTSKNTLAGIVGLSGHPFFNYQMINLGKIPILLFHGVEDSLLPISFVMNGYQKLNLNQQNKAKIYPVQGLDHGVNLQQLDAITKWINQTLQETKKQ